ncbi:MAG: hypothetical protein GF411_08865 [Candidatus Lokiarchaeota archaeon]|nr:hypothetical protein [Candidatus Lokiarchaeota archaeon]
MITQRKTGFRHWILYSRGYICERDFDSEAIYWVANSEFDSTIIFMVLFTQIRAGFSIGVTEPGFDFTIFPILGSILVMRLS